MTECKQCSTTLTTFDMNYVGQNKLATHCMADSCDCIVSFSVLYASSVCNNMDLCKPE